MNLPLINVFSSPYEAWRTRKPTYEEMMEHLNKHGKILDFINEEQIACVSNAKEAADYISKVGADNGLGNFINDALDKDTNFKSLRKCMPSKTPEALSNYQQKYPDYDSNLVDFEINNIGKSLSDSQYLFHGGELWFEGTSGEFITDRPLSTSFCPQVALRNAEHKGKAYDAGQINLLVLRIINSKTNVFSFRRGGTTNMGHENEVLFASGAKLVLQSRTSIQSNYSARKYGSDTIHKDIPIYVLEVDVS